MAEPFEHFENSPDPFKPKRTGSIFSFIESPASHTEKGYYEGVTNNKILIDRLHLAHNSNPKLLTDFYYKDYESHKTKLVRTEYWQKTYDDWKQKSVTSVVPIDSEFSVREDQYSRNIDIKSRLSKKNGNVEGKPRITASVDLSKRYTIYKMYFIFEEGTEYAPHDEMILLAIPGPPYDDSDGEGIVAIEMTCQNYLDYRIILNHISPKFNPETFFTYLFNEKRLDLAQTERDRGKLDNLYAQAPLFYIQSLSNEDLFLDLKGLMLYDKGSWFKDSSESMIKILTGFSDFKFVYDELYENPKQVKTIYRLINADSGPNSKETYCDFLTFLCLVYQTVEDPDELETVKLGGKYQIDSDLSGGKEDKVKIWNYYTTVDYVIDTQSTHNAYYDSNPIKEDTIFHDLVDGYYHPMQLMILEDVETGQSAIVPAIFIKRLSDIAEWEEVIRVLTTILTILSMLTSVGILFRGATGLIRLFAIVDIGVGTIDLALSNKDIRKALIDSGVVGEWFVENWPIISFMSSMGILSIQMAKGIIKNGPKLIKSLKSAKNVSVSKQIEALLNKARNVIKKLDQSFDQEVLRVIRNNFEIIPNKLFQKYVKDVVKKAKKKGVELEVKTIDVDHSQFANPNYLGAFRNSIRNKKKVIIFVREDCPKITWYHETWHLDDFLELGHKAYTKIAMNTPWLHEKSVWEKVLKNRNKWREVELADAYGYVKDYYRNKSQLELFNSTVKNTEMEDLLIKYNVK